MNNKPKIVKVVQTALQERAPPHEDDYEFVDTWPKDESKKSEEPKK